MDSEVFKIKKEMKTEINIERSVFIGQSYLVEDEAFAKSIIKSVKIKIKKLLIIVQLIL